MFLFAKRITPTAKVMDVNKYIPIGLIPTREVETAPIVFWKASLWMSVKLCLDIINWAVPNATMKNPITLKMTLSDARISDFTLLNFLAFCWSFSA